MAAIAVLLLLLYVGTIADLIGKVLRCHKAGCPVVALPDGYRFVITTIQGLVSALVVARLAVAAPGGRISIGRYARAAAAKSEGLAWAYVAIWLVVGLLSLVIGVMEYPTISQTLSDLGTSWLGVAVAAGYAYFGIRPPNPSPFLRGTP